jgi:TolB-like protein/class 3 adenylate cyclase/Tfp pilus assembly protein PilF
LAFGAPTTRRSPTGGQRRLVAIVFTDMVGFSALVHANESVGARLLDRHRRVVRATVREFGGRDIETAGDSFLLTFGSAHAALCCIARIGRRTEDDNRAHPDDPPVAFRASLHIGDVQNRGREVFGDGVNISARLLQLAPPGGVALSYHAHAQLRAALAPRVHSLGVQHLKNIEAEIEVLTCEPEELARIEALVPQRSAFRSRAVPLFAAVATVVMVGVGATLWFRNAPAPTATAPASAPPTLAPAAPAPTIAVLPFTPFSTGRDDPLLAFGLQDSILTNLARIGGLAVISRTSVMSYASNLPRNIRQIAAELGASTIVEGSLQRQGDRLMVQVQLIDASSDVHLWAQSYDRHVDDLFAVESDVARQVAAAVHARLAPSVSVAIDTPPTHDLAAYQEYLRARQLLDASTVDDLKPAQDALQRALALDPEFALAHVALAEVHSDLYANNQDRTPARLTQARDELARATELAPSLPELHRAWGRYYLLGRRELAPAAAEFATSMQLQPSNAEALHAMAQIHLEQGDLEAALVEQTRAVELDPRSFALVLDLASIHELRRDFAAVQRTLDRAERVLPGQMITRIYRARLAIAQSGDVHKARELLTDVDYAPALEKIAYYTGDFDEALRQLERQPPWQGSGTGAAPYPRDFPMAVDLWLKGDRAAAAVRFRSVVSQLEAALQRPDEAQWDQRTALAVAQAALGNDAVAQKLLDQVRACQDCVNPMTRGDILTSIAFCELLRGHRDAAIDALRELLAKPSFISANYVRLDPAWAPLRGDARFQQLLR